jgi:hypothetical protein
MSESKTHHGITKEGLVVHKKTTDHLPGDTIYARFNKKVALWISNKVMTMTAFWIFCVIALCSLPAVLNLLSPSIFSFFPHWLVQASLVSLIAWISSNFLQLVFLPALGVGQNLQNVAADVRSTKTFEDVETILDRFNLETAGGLKDLKDYIDTRFDRIEKDKQPDV